MFSQDLLQEEPQVQLGEAKPHEGELQHLQTESSNKIEAGEHELLTYW